MALQWLSWGQLALSLSFIGTILNANWYQPALPSLSPFSLSPCPSQPKPLQPKPLQPALPSLNPFSLGPFSVPLDGKHGARGVQDNVTGVGTKNRFAHCRGFLHPHHRLIDLMLSGEFDNVLARAQTPDEKMRL